MGNKFLLKEKMSFFKDIHILMTSNYLKYITDDSSFKEVFTNGENGKEQIFYLNGDKF